MARSESKSKHPLSTVASKLAKRAAPKWLLQETNSTGMHFSCLMGPPEPVQPEQDESHALQTASEVSSKKPGMLQNELKGQLPEEKHYVKLAREMRGVARAGSTRVQKSEPYLPAWQL